ncbi:MAG TPA: ATP-dependent Clp protease proteolytic subunit [Dehalococcoidales bacterium]|nr:ATP-dependent Clp protease proteolytic subunit [Dehalococcoidales bacterium]
MNSEPLRDIIPANVMPYVVESGPRGERVSDIYSMLLKERIVMLFTEITDPVANVLIAQLLYLDREDPSRDINMYIQSPGGIITAGLAIYDTMQLIHAQVSTICIGQAASMATVLLCSGAKGKRYALPHATIHMHQAQGGARGAASDINIAAHEINRQQDIIRTIIQKNTGQPMERIIHDTDRDFFLNPEQAVEYGIIDEVLAKPSDSKEDKSKKEKK